MQRSWALIALVGCSFQPAGSRTGDARGSDAADAVVAGDDVLVDVDAMDVDSTPPAPIAYVQGRVTTNGGSNNSVSRAFSTNQTAGNLNLVVISWGDDNDSVDTVTDSQGNTYVSAVGPTSNNSFTLRIYYAANIKAGANTVTVALTGNVPDPKLRIFEYSGLATVDPINQVAAAGGTSFLMQAGPITTTQPHELLFAANVCASVSGSGLGWNLRQYDNGDVVQDLEVTQTGMYSASSLQTLAVDYIIQLVALKAAP